MTDYRSNIAGNYPDSAPEITVILNEGNPTVGTSYDQAGRSGITLTWASEIKEGQWVALNNDTDNTFVATGGLVLVETAVNAETLCFIKITGTPTPPNMPATSGAADSLAKRLTGGYYRTARAKVYGGVTGIKKADVRCNGTNAVVPGVATTLNGNITSIGANAKLSFVEAAANGVGVIPFHAVPAGVDGDLYNCLVGLVSPMYMVTGV